MQSDKKKSLKFMNQGGGDHSREKAEDRSLVTRVHGGVWRAQHGVAGFGPLGRGQEGVWLTHRPLVLTAKLLSTDPLQALWGPLHPRLTQSS